jgi:hypothetical protein
MDVAPLVDLYPITNLDLLLRHFAPPSPSLVRSGNWKLNYIAKSGSWEPRPPGIKMIRDQ